MNKIFYNSKGWVCERFPNDFPIENEDMFVEVEDEDYLKSLETADGYAWAIENDKLINKVFDLSKVKQINLETIRKRREAECFSIINRGQLWYKTLTDEQLSELNDWYNSWLNITEENNKDKNGDYIIPQKPVWLN